MLFRSGKPTDVPRDSSVSGLGLTRDYQASRMKHYSFYDIAVGAHSFRFIIRRCSDVQFASKLFTAVTRTMSLT